MTTVRRLKVVSTIVAVAAVATCVHVMGVEPTKDKTKNFLTGPNQAPPARADRNLAEELANTKFSNQSLGLYQTQAGEDLFFVQVNPTLAAAAERPRDLLFLFDTGASQAGGPLATARQLIDELVKSAPAGDRISLWTVNTTAATQNLSRGFEPVGSPRLQEAL